MRKNLVIATRGSQLALWQAEHVKACLESLEPGLNISLRVIKTRGDIILDVPLSKVGGKCLDFCIGKCRFVHILTASHRGFAGHDLSDEFLFILDELPRITVKRTFRNITKYLDLIILVALS